MIIGTLTYHRADNYGAVLQAYALCQYLREQGYEAENIDYWPYHHAVVYKFWCWDKWEFHSSNWKGKIFYLLKFPSILLRSYKRKKNFDKFRKKKMKIASLRDSYDAVFYGSDTIWNRWNLNRFYTGFDSMYWGADSIKTKYRFSYAPSMGNVIEAEETLIQCQTYLRYFDKLSVREVQLRDKLEEWGVKDVQITVDPTLLLPKNIWDNLASRRIIKRNYILCYNLECSPVCKTMAENIGREKNLPVVQMTALVSKRHSSDIYDTAGPFEFLSLFKYASFVVTSSFHGCVFSIIFNKLFCFHSNVETERIISLLNSCGLSERFVNSPDTLAMYNTIDYESVNKELDIKISASRKFITECIQIVEKGNGSYLR